MNTNSGVTNPIQQQSSSCSNDQSNESSSEELVSEIFEHIRDIKDPELPQTLEELNVVTEDEIFVRYRKEGEACICINFTPTVPHCSLATLIGLCIRIKLQRCLKQDYKLDIYVTKGSHSIEDDVNKQINDKERVAAAMENPNLKKIVEECLQEVQY